MSEPATPNLDDQLKDAEIKKLHAETKDIQRRLGPIGKLIAPLLSALLGAVGGVAFYMNFFHTLQQTEVKLRSLQLEEGEIKLEKAERQLREAQDDFSREERKLLEERDRLEREKREAVSRIRQLEESLRRNGSPRAAARELESLREALSTPLPHVEEPRQEPPVTPSPIETPAPTPVETPAPQPEVRPERPRTSMLTGLLRPFAQKDFFVGDAIPQSKLQVARQAAGVPQDETVVALLVAEVLGPPQNVIVFGINRIYYNHQRYSRGSIPYSDLPELQFQALPNWGFDLGNGNYFNLAGSRVSPNTLVKILTALRNDEEVVS